MLSYEELAYQASQLDQKINENLIQKELLKTQEMVSKSKVSYQRNAYLKKLHEKLNLVITSRNKAQEANKRLLNDFDRIQKHLALMDSKTELLMAKVNDQKAYLDSHFPNWREKANMFVSPSYISQENMFNMLDTLRCRLSDTGNISFQNFSVSGGINLNGHESLVSMLKKSDHASKADCINDTQIPCSNSAGDVSIVSKSPRHVEINIQEKVRFPDKTDTLTNITESELPTNLGTDAAGGSATDEALSPRQSLDYSVENASNDTSVVDPLQGTHEVSFKFLNHGNVLKDDDIDTDFSEGNIENVLSPVKTVTTPPAQSPISSSKEKMVDSPGGSVDTVIRSPPGYNKKSKPNIKLSIPISQV